MSKLFEELKSSFTRIAIATQFLTIIPVKIKNKYDFRDVAKSLIYFPYVGFILGFIGILLNLVITDKFPFSKDIVIISVMTSLTGGLHFDGFMTIVDDFLESDHDHGIGGVVKENSHGAFGMLYLGILLFLKFLLYNNINLNYKNAALLIFPMISRMAMMYYIWISENKKNTSTAKLIDLVSMKEIIIVSIIPLSIAVLILKIYGVILIISTFLFILIYNYYIEKKITKPGRDVFGAINEIMELLVILFFSVIFK